MKKYVIFVTGLLALLVLSARTKAAEMNGVPMAGDSAADPTYYGAFISTISFSSAAVQAFIGRGVLIGVGCSSTTTTTYFDIFDASQPVNLNAGGDFPACSSGTVKRLMRINMTSGGVLISTNTAGIPVVGGDIKLPISVRPKYGIYGNISDQTVNNARLYWYAPQQ